MIFCTRQKNKNPLINIDINGNKIEQVKNTKFLGITIDQNLDWLEHILKLAKKISQISGTIYRVRSYLTREECLKLYNALIMPHLTYAIPIWGGANKTNLKILETAQKRIIRTIYGAKYNDHTSILFKKLKVRKLRDLYNLEL